MKTYLHIGGVVAAGFDRSGDYLLVISHGGRGVFSTKTWERVARDPSLAYPENGKGVGIGPIHGQTIPIVETDYNDEVFQVRSHDGRIKLDCESSGIEVTVDDT